MPKCAAQPLCAMLAAAMASLPCLPRCACPGGPALAAPPRLASSSPRRAAEFRSRRGSGIAASAAQRASRASREARREARSPSVPESAPPCAAASSRDRAVARASETQAQLEPESAAVKAQEPAWEGEDAAAFSVEEQSAGQWGAFFAVLAVVMGILYAVWLSPEVHLGTDYADFFKSLSSSSEVQITLMLIVFAIVHSGGAALRPKAEEVIGGRAYRVLFAGLSLPLAVSAVVFFINHRYDGTVLWNVRGVPGVHELVWTLSLVSFFFLYPSTFNLLEVAAVDTPRLHCWGTGIARITRHPQMVGQLIWCLAHTMWMGSSFTAVTSFVLCLHHAFGVWHGEQRLAAKYGDKFKEVQAKTSIVPFAAIIEGRQKLPADYYKEFLRAPYAAILAMTLGAYLVHPLMIQASFWLHW